MTHPDSITAFWGAQISTLEQISRDPRRPSASWYNIRPASFASAPSSLNVALADQLPPFCEMGGVGWLEGCVRGIPIFGKIWKSAAFPPTKPTDNPPAFPRGSVFFNDTHRFQACDVRIPPHSEVLW